MHIATVSQNTPRREQNGRKPNAHAYRIYSHKQMDLSLSFPAFINIPLFWASAVLMAAYKLQSGE